MPMKRTEFGTGPRLADLSSTIVAQSIASAAQSKLILRRFLPTRPLGF
jgi:hypothetical protein